jgi:hypothetical protein
MAEQKVRVTAAQKRQEIGVRLYVLALIALARRLQEEQDNAEGEVMHG